MHWQMSKTALILSALIASLNTSKGAAVEISRSAVVVMSEADSGSAQQGKMALGQPREPTLEERMKARFPQPALVGHLIGLPMLDGDDSTIGYVQSVVRTSDGKIRLIVPYRKHLGWAREASLFDWGTRRLVAVPIEVVAILARQIDVLDMDRAAFDKAPTWVAGQDQMLQPTETIRIGLARR